MQKRTVMLIGFGLPYCIACILAALVLLSLVSVTASYYIPIKTLTMVTMGLAPLVFAGGAIVCIVGAVKLEKKMLSLLCATSNIAVLAAILIFLLYPYIVELKVLYL